jgi:hypothetical protein
VKLFALHVRALLLNSRVHPLFGQFPVRSSTEIDSLDVRINSPGLKSIVKDFESQQTGRLARDILV